MKDRLHKIIARSGLTSRRKAEDLIRQGRVQVNGTVVTTQGAKADAANDSIEIDGVALEKPENRVYIVLNKPGGHITSRHDPQGRPTVYSLISSVPERVFSVGRLDFDTEGLLVMTNDGEMAQAMQHPRYGIPRTYLVKVHGVPSQQALQKLRKGIVIDGIKTSRATIRVLEKTLKNTWLEVILREGRNRQIKKMFDISGYRTMRIKRTAFGPLLLGKLPSGRYRFMNKTEISSLRKLIQGKGL